MYILDNHKMTDLPQRCVWTDNNSCVCLYCKDFGECSAMWRSEDDQYMGECPGDGDPECCGYINCPLWDEWLERQEEEFEETI